MERPAASTPFCYTQKSVFKEMWRVGEIDRRNTKR
jgi:hypothetical protein